MASVSDLRRITTQERLRSDHIALMEMLQVSVKENESLKAELNKLKQRQATEGTEATASADAAPAVPATESMSAMVQRILVQETSIKDLAKKYDDGPNVDEELESLKSGTNVDAELEALKSQIGKNE
jgi:regulator of replication initiation timing